MKKLFYSLAVMCLSVSAVAAQGTTEVPTDKYRVATNSFWSNWFVSAGVDFNAAYVSETGNCNKNPFSTDRGTFGFSVAVGKWFTPSIGLRTKFQGLWSKRVLTRTDHHTYEYWNAHEDVMFNLSNMLFGYNENRVWNFIPYVGIGIARNMSDNNYDISYNGGLLNNFRISKRVQVFADLYATVIEGSFDAANPDKWTEHKKDCEHHWDAMFGLNVGVTYNLGKTNWDKVPDVDALIAMNKEQMDALNVSLKDQQDENARLRDLLANQKPTERVIDNTKLVTTSQSVFFNINSSKIASRKDLVNVKEVAEYAKANNAKIRVTGYADSKTGNAQINQKLSEARANTVADELVKMGVSRDNIIVEAKGGVDTISPFSYNRRATVTLEQ